MPRFDHIGHISFSVSDCEKTAEWWRTVFGFEEIYRIQEDTWRAILLDLGDGNAIEFQQHDGNQGETFDPRRTGFDHMGFHVNDRDELVAWQEHFDRHGVTYTPIADREYGSVLTFKDPDRIQFELFHLSPELATAT